MTVERERLQVQVGMEVVGSDERHIGKVKECRSTDFLVDRRLKRDVYVPLDAIQTISDSGVMLNVASSEVNDMPWAKPSL